MPHQIVYDTEAVGKRRTDLFGRDEQQLAFVSVSTHGTTLNHCGICPFGPGQSCAKSCQAEREAYDKTDAGIKVY